MLVLSDSEVSYMRIGIGWYYSKGISLWIYRCEFKPCSVPLLQCSFNSAARTNYLVTWAVESETTRCISWRELHHFLEKEVSLLKHTRPLVSLTSGKPWLARGLRTEGSPSSCSWGIHWEVACCVKEAAPWCLELYGSELCNSLELFF